MRKYNEISSAYVKELAQLKYLQAEYDVISVNNSIGMLIEKVIFNDPATIVVWKDGTRTVVKVKDEPFDPEKGLAMAIAKRALGDKGNYYNVFKKWLPKDSEE